MTLGAALWAFDQPPEKICMVGQWLRVERWHGAEPGLTSHLQEIKATDCSMSHLGFSRDDNDGLYRLQRVELP